ncbi:hypothetical protein E8L90_06195 [Brevibacillus antibioticus]|uniref:Uncharacterized protein n=1 Tax=Brevibacillus antibioticus TaxID=2570228 RepID=A0A4U2Y3M8_9BACL|nr:type I polyketide synthase [Brevibacillus antibioticus]TKI55080.1 hypothetical protein E8L90_06195 [Brevibacillus antibioticus]
MDPRAREVILKLVAEQKLSPKNGAFLLGELTANGDSKATDNEIAIIGIAGKFPQSNHLDKLWHNLSHSVNLVSTFPSKRRKDIDPYLYEVSNLDEFYGYGGYLDEIDKFDADFFRITPKEARAMDPIQRLFLETSWECIENAGYGGTIYGTKTGVFVGNDHTFGQTYKHLMGEDDPLTLVGSYAGILSSRVSYVLNLRGPSLVIDTACSSGLVAVHTACQSLVNNECDMAIAGGIYLRVFPVNVSSMQSIESSTRIVRSFDNNADGTVWGEGVGAILLKPLKKALQDGDYIHATIKGSAVNNDGASNGITAPNASSQQELLLNAWKSAKIHPETLSYVEAHGTGTVLGDPVELRGLSSAFRKFTQRRQFCGIGSIKTNMGHLVSASGIASLLKVVMALKHKQIPATLHFTRPNQYISFEESPVYITDQHQDWKRGDTPRRAGISSFGFSGTNCHLVLEEAPHRAVAEQADYHGPWIFTVSAKTKQAFDALLQQYCDFFEKNQSLRLADVCYTTAVGRSHYNYRLSCIVNRLEDLHNKLCQAMEKDPTTLTSFGIYYGHHSDRVKGEKHAILQTKANSITQTFKTLPTEMLQEICQLYVEGADIDWALLYCDQSASRLPLPVYPLERTRYWFDRHSKANAFSEMSLKHKEMDRQEPQEQSTWPEVVLTGRVEGESYTKIERILGQVWGELLELEEIQIDGHFLEVGGNSLLAIKMEVELEKHNIELSHILIAEYPTIRELADYLSQEGMVEI